MNINEYKEWLSSLVIGTYIVYVFDNQRRSSDIVEINNKFIILKNGMRFLKSSGISDRHSKCRLLYTSPEEVVYIRNKQHIDSIIYNLVEFFSDNMWFTKLKTSTLKSIYELIRKDLSNV